MNTRQQRTQLARLKRAAQKLQGEELLLHCLRAAVPEWTAQLTAMSEGDRWAFIEEHKLADVTALVHYGDILLYGGGKPGEVTDLFNSLARSLAALSFAPGGVTFLGEHWPAHSPSSSHVDYETAINDGAARLKADRKTSGSYFTPESLIELMMETTVTPVVDDALLAVRAKRAQKVKQRPDEMIHRIDVALNIPNTYLKSNDGLHGKY